MHHESGVHESGCSPLTLGWIKYYHRQGGLNLSLKTIGSGGCLSRICSDDNRKLFKGQ